MKTFPFNDQLVAPILEKHSPVYVYDAASIRSTAYSLTDAFSWVQTESGIPYRNFFAVKATPTPAILKLLHENGMGFDASSGVEVELSVKSGAESGEIMFSSNNTAPEEYTEAAGAGALINLDDINQLEVMLSAVDTVPEFVSYRYNPGLRKDFGVNEIIGKPQDAKFGVPDDQIIEAYRRAQEAGITRFGIHTMLASNEVSIPAHIQTAQIVFEKAVQLREELGIDVEMINLGGGLGIPYRPDDGSIDTKKLGEALHRAYSDVFIGDWKPAIATEYGRFVTGPHGYLLTTVRSIKDTYHRFVGVDATMANLMRPGMYDSYHHISILGDTTERPIVSQAVVGSLCENNDFFSGGETKFRDLPQLEVGDVVIIHDAGAHGHSMGFNYNGKLRCAEYLVDGDEVILIRHPQTRDNYLESVIW